MTDEIVKGFMYSKATPWLGSECMLGIKVASFEYVVVRIVGMMHLFGGFSARIFKTRLRTVKRSISLSFEVFDEVSLD